MPPAVTRKNCRRETFTSMGISSMKPSNQHRVKSVYHDHFDRTPPRPALQRHVLLFFLPPGACNGVESHQDRILDERKVAHFYSVAIEKKCKIR